MQPLRFLKRWYDLKGAKLEKESEKRGWKLALARFAFDVWGEAEARYEN
jgi:hypothetical protein